MGSDELLGQLVTFPGSSRTNIPSSRGWGGGGVGIPGKPSHATETG